MIVPDEHIDHLVIGFLNNDLTSEEEAAFRLWLKESPEHQKYFDDWRELWFSFTDHEDLQRFNHEDAFQAFQERVRAAQKRNGVRYWVKYVSIIIFMIGLGYGSYWAGIHHLKSHFGHVTMESPKGSRSKLHLPDGTVVWLNADSKLTYSQSFGVDERNVHLEGEAFFEVFKNTDIPFLVKLQDVVVQVHGTKFNVSNYLEHDKIIVSLAEGQVSMYHEDNIEHPYYLLPGQQATYDKKQGEISMKVEDAKSMKDWITGKLKFQGEPLTEMADILERTYNVRIRIKNPDLKQFCFYGDFDSSKQSISQVLQTLGQTGKLHYRITNNEIELY